MSSQLNGIMIMAALYVLAAESASCTDLPQTDHEFDVPRGVG
jgi:hypothetical protein